MATRTVPKFDKSRPVVVRVPGKRVANVDGLQKILRDTLGKLGCPACLSGFTITLTDLPVLVADEKLDIRAI